MSCTFPTRSRFIVWGLDSLILILSIGILVSLYNQSELNQYGSLMLISNIVRLIVTLLLAISAMLNSPCSHLGCNPYITSDLANIITCQMLIYDILNAIFLMIIYPYAYPSISIGVKVLTPIVVS